MNQGNSHPHRAEATAASAEDALRHALARGDAAAASVAPVLRHLLTHDEHVLFAEDILATLRGMLADLARQLCEEMVHAAGIDEAVLPDDPTIPSLAASLAEQSALVAHLHALALEGRATARLADGVGVDPVLSPLLQALVGSEDRAISGDAMSLLAAQARFVRALGRMQLPLAELPGELLHMALQVLRAAALAAADEADWPECVAVLDRAEAAVRARYDEGATRIGLLARLVSASGGGTLAGLALGHAGVAIFASALALSGGMAREGAILAMQGGQEARLALALRSAGVKPASVSETLLALHGEVTLPDAIARLSAEGAAALLAGSA